jgi:hypothetical protein
MTDPMTPPTKLWQQWEEDWHYNKAKHIELEPYIATQAAQWGADQELEACCQSLYNKFASPVHQAQFLAQELRDWLRAARRPKPPSAVAQAETLIERHEDGWVPSPAQWHTIREGLAEGRRALEALPND